MLLTRAYANYLILVTSVILIYYFLLSKEGKCNGNNNYYKNMEAMENKHVG
jgi:hypothetical protein